MTQEQQPRPLGTIWQQMADGRFIGGTLQDLDPMCPAPETEIVDVKAYERDGAHYFKVVGKDYEVEAYTGPKAAGALGVHPGPLDDPWLNLGSQFMRFRIKQPGT